MPEGDQATDIGNKHKNLVKIARVVPEIFSRTDRRHEDIQTYSSQYFATSPVGEVNITDTDSAFLKTKWCRYICNYACLSITTEAACLKFTFAHVHVRYTLSPIRLSSVCSLSSVCLSVVNFGNFSTAFGTLAIR